MNKISAIAAAILAAGCCCKEQTAIESRPFGTLKTGEQATIYTLKSDGGLTLEISDFGGRLVRACAPDRDGKMADVTLGWNNVGDYETLGFSMGTLIGRYGNRIADGKFVLDGVEFQLPLNETDKGRHCNLHGGPDGWDKKIWKAKTSSCCRTQTLELEYVSADGEMGFPGEVTVKAVFKVFPGNVFRIDYSATTDKPTVINPTHHSYWNLAGEASGDVLGQELQIFASRYTAVDKGLIPVENRPVEGTGFDFRELRPIGAMAEWMAAQEELAPMDNWYDHNFVLDGDGAAGLRKAAFMRDPASGRTLEVWTTEPGMQVYGAQNMDDTLPSKTPGKNLCQFAGIALETQHFPDSPNRPDFPSTVLRPGETFRSTTEYRFGVDAK